MPLYFLLYIIQDRIQTWSKSTPWLIFCSGLYTSKREKEPDYTTQNPINNQKKWGKVDGLKQREVNRGVVIGSRRSRSDPTLLVAAEELFGLRVPEGAAGDDVNPDEDNRGHDQDNVGPPPITPQVAQETCLARVAVVAELGLVVAPQVAIRVCIGVHRVLPHCRVHVHVATRCWGLATP